MADLERRSESRRVERRHEPGRQVALAEKIAFLLRPETYPEATGRVESIETHMSWVFLTPTRAYKLKKPVRYRSLDDRSLAARHRNCRNEVQLNRRLAPGVYLDCIPLVRDARGALQLGGEADAVDWLVEMKRLPESRTLRYALEHGGVDELTMKRIAHRLVVFFQHSAPATDLRAAGVVARMRNEVLSARRKLVRAEFALPTERVEETSANLLDFLTWSELIRLRVEAGRYVEGHGDLRPEHVYLGNGVNDDVVITDCLEFDRRLRMLDPVDEIAFLAIECEHLGATNAWHWLFDAYRAAGNDVPPGALCEFHGSYRALLRARNCIEHLERLPSSDARDWRERAANYIQIAAEHANRL